MCKANGEGPLRSSWRWGLGVGEGSAHQLQLVSGFVLGASWPCPQGCPRWCQF